ncbi:hypothetical protein AOLI_G00105480 [Acnodon oligacanthus]
MAPPSWHPLPTATTYGGRAQPQLRSFVSRQRVEKSLDLPVAAPFRAGVEAECMRSALIRQRDKEKDVN